MSRRKDGFRANNKLISCLVGASCVYLTGPNFVFASEEEIEEIVVTGSYIKHLPEDSPTPVQVVDRMELEASGVPQIADIMGNLTVNSGSEFRSNLALSNGMAGSANINLRGLGLGSTLVLMNGKRLTLSSIVSNDGSSFVDINQIPMNMIEAIEVQKDGAAATYGTDAVAGVVNFKTRSDFEGFELRLGNQSTVNDFQMDNEISMLWGAGNGRTHAVVSVLAFDRSPLDTLDRDFAITEHTVSTLGDQGAFLVNGAPVMNPNCVEGGGIPGPIGGSDTLGTCGFQFGGFFELVAPETRTNIYSIISHEFDNQTEFIGEITYYQNKVDNLKASPSFPMLSFPIVPADNPGNPVGVDAPFLGRVSGVSGSSQLFDYQTESNRVALSFNNDTGDLAGWTWDAGLSYSSYRRVAVTTDTQVENFNRAVNGVGGDDCNEAIGSDAAGEGNCFYFNVGAGTEGNSPAIYPYLEGTMVDKSATANLVLDNVYTREISQWEFAGGTAEMAMGWQYRKEEFSTSPSANLQTADDEFFFIGSITAMDEDQDVVALFSELALPITDTFEAQLALRFEDYGGKVGSSTDPKLALRWDAADNVVVRGSLSSTFKAPTLSQRFSSRTALERIVSDAGRNLFIGVRAAGSEDLKPEEAITRNLGVIVNLLDAHTLSADYWGIDFEDVIVKENAQQIADAYYADNSTNNGQLDISDAGFIVGIDVQYVNAAEIKTDGIDLAWTWDIDTSNAGGFRSKWIATWINSYDFVDQNGVKIDALDNLNSTNSARPLQDLKFNWSLDWSMGQHNANFTWHYVDSYESDGADLEKIDSHNTFDVQYAYNFVRMDAVAIMGIANLTDEDPPTVETEFGYDSFTHDPRGMMAYLRGKINF